MPGSGDLGVAADDLAKQRGVEHVVAHRDIGDIRVVWNRLRLGRFLGERQYPSRRIGFDDAERTRLGERYPDACNGNAGAGHQVGVDHLSRVHAIDVVCAKHHHVGRIFVGEDVEALIDRIRRSGEPVGTPAHLCRHRVDVVAQHRGHPPGHCQVPVETMRLVLSQDRDLADAPVDKIRQHKVYEAVHTAEWHCGLRPIPGQGVQPLALATCQHQTDDLLSLAHVTKLDACHLWCECARFSTFGARIALCASGSDRCTGSKAAGRRRTSLDENHTGIGGWTHNSTSSWNR